MHDMSKAFDSVNRNILEQDELHLIRILLTVERCSTVNVEYIQVNTSKQTLASLKETACVQMNSLYT